MYKGTWFIAYITYVVRIYDETIDRYLYWMCIVLRVYFIIILIIVPNDAVSVTDGDDWYPQIWYKPMSGNNFRIKKIAFVSGNIS